jgi:sodium transport system ATP-binding protein
LTCEENIAYFGQLNDMRRDKINDRIKTMAKAFGMEEYIKKRAGKLSKGMKQKVAFARAIIHDPDIMLFDEPTSGLDVSAMKDVHEFIRACKKNGKTIVFSSHTMSEVERLCDRIAIIHKGELIEKGKVEELKNKYGCDSLEDIFLRLVGDNNES